MSFVFSVRSCVIVEETKVLFPSNSVYFTLIVLIRALESTTPFSVWLT